MFTTLAPKTLARWEPSEQRYLLLHQNRLRRVLPGSKIERALQKVVPTFWQSVPRNVQIQVTKVCNLRCSFCYAAAQRGRSATPSGCLEMPEPTLLTLINRLYHWGVPNIQYVGGETFMRKDFPSIVQYTQSLGLSQSLITNGIIPGSAIEKFSDTLKSFCRIQISMNGVGDRYDRLVGLNAFDRFRSAVARITKIHPNVWLSFVVTEDNYFQIEEALEMTRLLGACGIRFGILARKGRSREASFQYFQVLEKARLLLARVRPEYPELGIDCHFDLDLNQKVGTTPKSKDTEGRSMLYVNKDGELFPFPLLELPEFRLGNALTDDLAAIWNHHPVLQHIRDSQTEHPICARCPKACALRSPSLRYLWTGSFSEKLPCKTDESRSKNPRKEQPYA